MSSFNACLFSSASLVLQFSHQIPLSLPGELPLPEAGDPVPNPGEPPRDPGDPVPIPGEMVPGEPEKDPGEEIPEPGDGVPVELGIEPAPSGAGRVLERLVSSYAFLYHVSGKMEADLVGEVSGTPYFLLRLLTDLSLVPDSEVMLQVRGGGGGGRGSRRGERTSVAALHPKRDHLIEFN